MGDLELSLIIWYFRFTVGLGTLLGFLPTGSDGWFMSVAVNRHPSLFWIHFQVWALLCLLVTLKTSRVGDLKHTHSFTGFPEQNCVASMLIFQLSIRSSRIFVNSIPGMSAVELEEIPPLLTKCYTPEVLSLLFAMRDLFLAEFDRKTPESELLWLALTAVLRSCSGVGTAQWQYVLPNKSKSGVQTPLAAFHSKATEILQDVEYAQRSGWCSGSHVLMTDARAPEGCTQVQVDAVVTSPPYPNNYDYADATRLEMTFWGEITSWGDLQDAVRHYLIRSCSQHAAAEKLVLDDLLSEPRDRSN